MLQAKKDGLCIRALAVITPGNPTGQVIPRSNIEDLIKFSKKNDLAVIADEVYQVNVYNSSMKFDSFKKTIRDMGSDYDDVPLFSLQSISKGYYGNSPGISVLRSVASHTTCRRPQMLSTALQYCLHGAQITHQLLFSCSYDLTQNMSTSTRVRLCA